MSLSSAPMGLTGQQEPDYGAMRIALIVLFSIALYNSVELFVLIFVTFSTFTGLYFWSLLLSDTLGVIPHSVGYLLNFFGLAPKWLVITISTVGYYFMVPGQSVVLYSRLHLVVNDLRLLRRIKYFIIVASIVVVVPTTVLTYGTNLNGAEGFVRGYNVVERFQLTWFCVQESTLAGIYIRETIRLLRLNPNNSTRRRKIMYELLAINVIIILLDVALVVLEYLGMYDVQVTFKSAVYSVKLKLEFGVLGKLVSLVNMNRSAPNSDQSTAAQYPDFVDPSRFAGDFTHAAPQQVDRDVHSQWPLNGISMESLQGSDRQSHGAARSVKRPQSMEP